MSKSVANKVKQNKLDLGFSVGLCFYIADMHYNKLRKKLVCSEIFIDCEGISHQLRCLTQLHKKDMRNKKKIFYFFYLSLKNIPKI